MRAVLALCACTVLALCACTLLALCVCTVLVLCVCTVLALCACSASTMCVQSVSTMCVHSVSTSCAVLLRECSVSISTCMYNDNSAAVKWLDLEKNGIKMILISLNSEFFVE